MPVSHPNRRFYATPITVLSSITAKKRVESIIDFTTDFKSIVKSRHDLTVKSSALDLRFQINCESIIDLTRFFTVHPRVVFIPLCQRGTLRSFKF